MSIGGNGGRSRTGHPTCSYCRGFVYVDPCIYILCGPSWPLWGYRYLYYFATSFINDYWWLYWRWRRRVIGISGFLIWSKTLMELIFNPFGEFRWSPEDSFSQIHSPHLHVGTPGIFSDLLRSVQMLKRDCGAKSNGKLRYLLIATKTATSVPEFAEDLPLGRTAALVPEFAVKDLPLDRTLWWWWWWW